MSLFPQLSILPVYPIFLSRPKRHLDRIPILSTPPTNSIKLLRSKFGETVNTIPHSPVLKIFFHRVESNSVTLSSNHAPREKFPNSFYQPTTPFIFSTNDNKFIGFTNTKIRCTQPWTIVVQPNGANLLVSIRIRTLLARRHRPTCARERGGRNRLSHVPSRMCRGTREPASNAAPIDFRRASMSGVARPRASKPGI